MSLRPRARSRAPRTFAVAVAIAASTAASTLAGAAPAVAASKPVLTLEAGRSSVTLERYAYDDEVDVYGSLGTYAVASPQQAFEVQAQRTSYAKPISAVLVLNGRDRDLPAPADFEGLPDFTQTTFRDSKGKVAATMSSPFCPNTYSPVRRTPQAPASSPYPYGCNANPYSLGAVWGIQRGWAASLTDGFSGLLPDLALGSYTATTTIAPAYQKPLGLTAAQASVSVKVTVVKGEDGDCDSAAGCLQAARATSLRGVQQRSALRSQRVAEPAALQGKASTPVGPRPDLRSLPAWGIDVDGGRYLRFSATVWNAGPGRLVVDGFRSADDPDLMDAYQYFFSDTGKQLGYAPVGGMEWDARDGHNHWHFKDFATYQLLDANKKLVVRSQKEAFCLANTDAVDYTVEGANWRPDNTDLHTACGERDSLGVREVLDTGSGDTYVQDLPGQSFDLNGVKNGTYYIQVLANPEKVLYEASTTNNSSLRKVVIGGTSGARTVKVEKVGLVVEPYYGEDGAASARR